MKNLNIIYIVRGQTSDCPDVLANYAKQYPELDVKSDMLEWQFSDGIPGERGDSSDFLTLESGFQDHIKELADLRFYLDKHDAEIAGVDVHLIDRDSFTPAMQSQFHKRWLVQFADGSIEQFDSEAVAAFTQRLWRVSNDMDPMTGEKVSP